MIEFLKPDGLDFGWSVFESEQDQWLLIVVKTTYSMQDSGGFLQQMDPDPLLFEPLYEDPKDPIHMIQDADVSAPNPGTELAVSGKVWNPHAASQVPVGIKVGSREVWLQAFGPRFWQKSLLGWSVSAPEPIEELALDFKHAYGGVDPNLGEPFHWPWNPLGMGYFAPQSKQPLEGTPLPQLERHGQLITKWQHRPYPLSFGFVLPHWEPRRTQAGTYDEQWLKTGFPGLPSDFSPQHYFSVLPDLSFEPDLKPGDSVMFKNIAPWEDYHCQIPQECFSIRVKIGSEWQQTRSKLDRLFFQTDALKLNLLHKAVIKVTRRLSRVRRVEVRHV